MPVWQEADRFGLVVSDPEDYDYAWSHSGMDEPTARRLLEGTLDQARRHNDRAVLMHWQAIYEHPFLPHRSRATNLRVEKAIERLAMAHRDTADERAATRLVAGQLAVLEQAGVVLAPAGG